MSHIRSILYHALKIVCHENIHDVIEQIPHRIKDEAARLVEITNTWSTQTNIVGFGIARKSITGIPSGEYALVIYVKEKLLINDLMTTAVIPGEIIIDNTRVRTDVIELGNIELCSVNEKRQRPAYAGCSIGYGNSTTGSIGLVFVRKGLTYLITSGHVISPYGARVGDNINQPGFLDSEGGDDDVIAKSIYVSTLDPGSGYTNILDLGIGQAIGNGVLTPGRYTLEDYTLPRRGMNVMFNGRTSNESRGSIVDTFFYGRFLINGRYIGFGRQILSTCPSAPGDSGALLTTMEGLPVGILLGGSSRGSVFNWCRDASGLVDTKLA